MTAQTAASTALTGTRTNEKLENLPNSISVLTADFLNDIAAFDFFDAAEFGVSTENVANDNGTRGAPVGARSGNQLSFRGMPAVRQLRDGFPWYVPLDVFNTERIEFNRGPGGLAYGDVDAGGIVNISTKRATFRRAHSAQVRFDDWGTKRGSIDLNQPLVRDQLAFRVNAVASDRESWRQRGGSKLHAYAAALRFTPTRKTTLDATIELGRQSDGLTHVALTDMTAAYLPGSGTNALDANPNQAGVQTNGVGMSRTMAPGNTQVWSWIDGRLYNLESTATAVFRNTFINQGGGAAVVSGADPQNPNRIAYLPAPESILPRGEDWGGPGNFVENDWVAYTLELKHEVNDKLRLLVAHNAQRDTVKREKSMNDLLQKNTGFGARSLHRDISPNLPGPNGTLIPNPRYEQYFVQHHQLLNNDGRDVLNFRGVAVYDLDLPKGITQRLVGSLGYRTEEYRRDVFAESLTEQEIAARGLTGVAARYANNFFYRYHYLRDGNSDGALQNRVIPGVSTFTRHNQLGTNARFKQSLTSVSANAIGSYFKGRVRSSVGISRDRWHQRSAELADHPVTGERVILDANGAPIPEGGAIPVFELTRQGVTNQTYGLVWHVLPWVSLSGGYFESAQFTDNTTGLLLDGSSQPPQTGEGHDFGLRFKLWQDRITLALTRFETIGENVSSGINAGARDELNPLLSTSFANLTDLRDRTSEGYEAELFFNFGRQWTARAAYSENSVIFTRFFPLLEARLAEARATASARGLDPDAATIVTTDYLQDQRDSAEASERRTANLTVRYSFIEGTLNGLSLGLAARYQALPDYNQVSIGGQVVIPAREARGVYVFSPFATYRHRFGRFTWTGQVNVNNVFDRVVQMSPGYRFTRYNDPRQIIFTSTFSF